MFRDRSRPIDSADDAIVSAASLLPQGKRVTAPETALAAAIFKDAIRCLQRTGMDGLRLAFARRDDFDGFGPP
jgi:hypothetical protein